MGIINSYLRKYFSARIIISLLLMGIFIGLWFKLVDFSKVAGAVANIEWGWVGLSLVISLVNSVFAAKRLKVILSLITELSAGFIWKLGYLASLISLIVPFSAGGLGMAYIISKKTQSRYSRVLTWMGVNMGIGVGVNLVIATLALIYFSQKLVMIELKTELLLGVVLGGLLMFAVYCWLLGNWQRLRGLVIKIWQGWLLVQKENIAVQVIEITMIMLLLGTIGDYLMFVAFGMKPLIIEYLLAMSLFGLLNLIPGMLVKIGQYETLGILTLPILLDLDNSQVFAMLLVNHGLSVTITLVLGWWSLYRLKGDLEVQKELAQLRGGVLNKLAKTGVR